MYFSRNRLESGPTHHRTAASAEPHHAKRTLRLLSAIALACISAVAFTQSADAAGEQDKEALRLHDQAMDEDYLAVEFAKAEKKLKDALKKCGSDGCTPKVLGKLHIAMGTVHGANNKLDLAKESFVAALKADPQAQLNESFTTPELAKAFAAAQKQVGTSGKTGGDKTGGDKTGGDKTGGDKTGGDKTGGDKTGGGDTGEEPGGKKPAGDLNHTPPAEQTVNTPVPIYIEVPDEVGATKVTLRYKPFGANKWKTIEMQKVGNGYGVEIPCEDVTTTGDVKYFIIAKDDQGDPVGTAGSMKEPYKVPIKNEIEGDAPALPGKKAPEECAAKEDCPPGLPGCPGGKTGPGAKRGEKGWGSSCEQTEECKEGLICLNGTCEEDTGQSGTTGPSTPAKAKKNIVGLWGQLDLLLINSAENVCSGVDPAYVCFYSNKTDQQFYGLPTDQRGTNGIQGGFGVGGGRVMLSYERQLLDNLPLTVGLKLGFAFGGSPSSSTTPFDIGGKNSPHVQANSFLPFHGEARASYYFGPNAFEHRKLRPFVFLGGGLAQVNASVPVGVCDGVDDKGALVTDPSGECKEGKARKLDAYQITGLNFIGLGGGVNYGILPNFGVAFELKVMLMVPTFGVVFAPTVGPIAAF